jgi:hypothetical protein
MMNEQQIAARLLELHNAYVERTGKQPYLSMTLNIAVDGKCQCIIWHSPPSGMAEHARGRGPNSKAALDALAKSIAAIPSEAEVARNKAAQSVAQAIEDCRAAGFPDDFINPLSEMSKRISENALGFAE